VTMKILPIAILFAHSAIVTAGEDMSISELIAETGVREGQIAMRDRPGWNATPTIVVRHRDGITDDLEAAVPGATIIAVGSVAEAVALDVPADIFLGMCNAEAVDEANKLVWVQVFSSGVERCMGAQAIANGDVVLTNMQKMSSPAIGEHAGARM